MGPPERDSAPGTNRGRSEASTWRRDDSDGSTRFLEPQVLAVVVQAIHDGNQGLVDEIAAVVGIDDFAPALRRCAELLFRPGTILDDESVAGFLAALVHGHVDPVVQAHPVGGGMWIHITSVRREFSLVADELARAADLAARRAHLLDRLQQLGHELERLEQNQ